MGAHPRLRGDHFLDVFGQLPSRGSSPPARGPLCNAPRRVPCLRLIPACAGTTLLCSGRELAETAHPRLRGDHEATARRLVDAQGSSPPARGPLCPPPTPSHRIGLIPACAGTTRISQLGCSAWRAHPRLRGDHSATARRLVDAQGSSPPARGPLCMMHSCKATKRLIPACAGTTRISQLGCSAWRAHPRLRGDHSISSLDVSLAVGSSPPARGPLDAYVAGGDQPGLVPACAGTTSLPSGSDVSWGAHPRLRGDHCMGAARVGGFVGSSPPARGPHAGRGPADRGPGLIPACAGTTPS